MRLSTTFLPTLVLLCSCVVNGERPGDMTIAQHETMARAEDGAAAANLARFNPKARDVREFCSSWAAGSDVDVCWASVRNPTASELARAEDHKRRAAEHRRASRALRDAEVSACAGVSELDRSVSPFEHRAEIARVELLDTNAQERRVSRRQRRWRARCLALPGTPG